VTDAPSLPAHSVEAEQSVVSAALCGGDETMAELVDLMAPEDCYQPAARWALRAAWDLFEAGEPVDLVSVTARLRARKRLDEAGGSQELHRLASAGMGPSLRNALDHARRIALLARVRAVAAVCGRIQAEGTTVDQNAAEWLSEAEARVYEAAAIDDHAKSTADIREVVDDEQRAAHEAQQGTADEADLGVLTGLHDLDRALGCLKFGYKYALGAFPGGGKTALAIQVAASVAEHGHGVAIASQEMDRTELVRRAISQHSRINNRTVERYQFAGDEWDKAAAAWKHLRGLPIKIDDRSSFSVASLRAWLRRIALQFAREDRALRFVVVDHMHLMATRSGRREEQDIADLSGGLREIAKDFSVALLELHPFNRATHDQKRPTMRSFKGSSAIEHDCYGVLALHREDLQQMDRDAHDGGAELLLLKVRGGGETGRVNLRFTDYCTRFDSVAGEPDYDETPAYARPSDDWADIPGGL